jgi:hypothetical protein
MPTIYDNIEKKLLEGLRVSLKGAKGASFAIGYFHLRGWGEISDLVDAFVVMPNHVHGIIVITDGRGGREPPLPPPQLQQEWPSPTTLPYDDNGNRPHHDTASAIAPTGHGAPYPDSVEHTRNVNHALRPQ